MPTGPIPTPQPYGPQPNPICAFAGANGSATAQRPSIATAKAPSRLNRRFCLSVVMAILHSSCTQRDYTGNDCADRRVPLTGDGDNLCFYLPQNGPDLTSRL